MAIPFTLEGQHIEISASVGVALFPDHGVDELSFPAYQLKWRAVVDCAAGFVKTML